MAPYIENGEYFPGLGKHKKKVCAMLQDDQDMREHLLIGLGFLGLSEE